MSNHEAYRPFVNDVLNLVRKGMSSESAGLRRLGFMPRSYGVLLEALPWKCSLAVIIECVTDTSSGLATFTDHVISTADNVMVQEAATSRSVALDMLCHGTVCGVVSGMAKSYTLAHNSAKVGVRSAKKALRKRICQRSVIEVLKELLPDRREERWR